MGCKLLWNVFFFSFFVEKKCFQRTLTSFHQEKKKKRQTFSLFLRFPSRKPIFSTEISSFLSFFPFLFYPSSPQLALARPSSLFSFCYSFHLSFSIFIFFHLFLCKMKGKMKGKRARTDSTQTIDIFLLLFFFFSFFSMNEKRKCIIQNKYKINL